MPSQTPRAQNVCVHRACVRQHLRSPLCGYLHSGTLRHLVIPLTCLPLRTMRGSKQVRGKSYNCNLAARPNGYKDVKGSEGLGKIILCRSEGPLCFDYTEIPARSIWKEPCSALSLLRKANKFLLYPAPFLVSAEEPFEMAFFIFPFCSLSNWPSFQICHFKLYPCGR